MACKVAIESLKVILEEKLCENSNTLEQLLKTEFELLPKALVRNVRGKGLIYGIELKSPGEKITVSANHFDLFT